VPLARLAAFRFVSPAPLPESVLAALVMMTVPVKRFVPVNTFVPLSEAMLVPAGMLFDRDARFATVAKLVAPPVNVVEFALSV
jgi:hypothetical protein